jgi:hypothetical protein
VVCADCRDRGGSGIGISAAGGGKLVESFNAMIGRSYTLIGLAATACAAAGALSLSWRNDIACGRGPGRPVHVGAVARPTALVARLLHLHSCCRPLPGAIRWDASEFDNEARLHQRDAQLDLRTRHGPSLRLSL